MHILYVDESGVEQIGVPPPHFVLLGLAIPAADWKSLDTSLGNLKATYQLRDQEIHAAWMHRRYSEQESIPGYEKLDPADLRLAAEEAIRKRAGKLGVLGKKQKVKAYRREARAISPYLHLTREQRLKCLEDLAKEVASWNEVRIFADAINKDDFVPGRSTPYEMAFEQVLTRFQSFLTYKRSSGIVVHDHNDTAAPRLTRLARKFHDEGTFYRQITNIVETPLFVDSSLTSMIQIADLCAFALRRQLENQEDRLWDIIEARVDRRGSTHVGVRHYTARRPCACRICEAHGRNAS